VILWLRLAVKMTASGQEVEMLSEQETVALAEKYFGDGYN
jgi:hypothetical protein